MENIEVLRPALTFLRQAFKYACVHQESASFLQERQDLGEAILGARLLSKLREFNPDLSETGLRQALNALASPPHASLLANQQELYDKMLAASWRTAQTTAQHPSGDGATSEESKALCHYFDFENPDRNDFLIVEQFRFAGPGGVRTLDAVLFVNGIPLAVFEARSVHETAGVRHGIEHLQQLQAPQEISRLFHTIHLLVVLQKSAACYGSVAARSEEFRTWEDCWPLSWEELRLRLRQTPHRENDLPTAQDILLAGLFSPQNLLELLRGFALFVASPRGPEKKLARCHQFQSAQTARARLVQAEPSELRSASGIIVHPAGTGKSLSLLWLACALRREAGIARHPMLVLTARQELIELLKAEAQRRRWPPLLHLPADAALAQALAGAKNDTLIASPAQLRAAIQSNQRNREALPPFAPAPMVVLVDEALSAADNEFMLDLEQAFPQAAIVAFSSFPLPNQMRARLHGLQNEIHVYARQQAEHDGYILPVKFEMRLPEWHIETAAERDRPGRTDEFHVQHGDDQSSSFSRAANETRLRAIADDILLHFRQDIAANGNHGILLAADTALGARYFELLVEEMPGEVLALLAEPELLARRQPRPGESGDPEKILKRFMSSEQPLLLIVAENVRAPLSTGRTQALYIDRPLRRLAWLEAIALTQRTGGENKSFGLLVDYWGVSGPAIDSEADARIVGRYDPTQFEELEWWRRELAALFDFYPEPNHLEAALLAIAATEKRMVFAKAWRIFARWLDQLMPQIRHEQAWQEACWWNHIRKEAAAFFYDDTLAAGRASLKLERWFQEDARLHGPAKIRDQISLYGQDFWQELEIFETLGARILRLMHVLYHEIRRAAPVDPVYYQALEQRVRKIEMERQLGRLDDPGAFARLREEATRLAIDKGERSQAMHALAFAGILQRFLPQQEGEPPAHDAQREKLANDLLAALAPEMALVDWHKRQEVQREMRRKIKRLLREAGCPQSVQEPLTSELMKITRARLADQELIREP
ncbi:MAG: type I restriction endonuclease [bacterium]